MFILWVSVKMLFNFFSQVTHSDSVNLLFFFSKLSVECDMSNQTWPKTLVTCHRWGVTPPKVYRQWTEHLHTWTKRLFFSAHISVIDGYVLEERSWFVCPDPAWSVIYVILSHAHIGVVSSHSQGGVKVSFPCVFRLYFLFFLTWIGHPRTFRRNSFLKL